MHISISRTMAKTTAKRSRAPAEPTHPTRTSTRRKTAKSTTLPTSAVASAPSVPADANAGLDFDSTVGRAIGASQLSNVQNNITCKSQYIIVLLCNAFNGLDWEPREPPPQTFTMPPPPTPRPFDASLIDPQLLRPADETLTPHLPAPPAASATTQPATTPVVDTQLPRVAPVVSEQPPRPQAQHASIRPRSIVHSSATSVGSSFKQKPYRDVSLGRYDMRECLGLKKGMGNNDVVWNAFNVSRHCFSH